MSYHSYTKNRGEKKKSRVGVKKDRIYTKHGLLNGRLIRPAKIPSLTALAARKLPDTKDWEVSADSAEQDVRNTCTRYQQKSRKKTVEADIVNRVANKYREQRKAIIKPLSDREIEHLLLTYEREGVSTPQTRDLVRAFLTSLQEIPEDHVPNPFFHSYDEQLRRAKQIYEDRLKQNLQEVKDDIREVANEIAKSKSFEFERDYTWEHFRGSSAARELRKELDTLAKKSYDRSLLVAETYRNDLYNYAESLAMNEDDLRDAIRRVIS